MKIPVLDQKKTLYETYVAAHVSENKRIADPSFLAERTVGVRRPERERDRNPPRGAVNAAESRMKVFVFAIAVKTEEANESAT